MKGLKGEWKKIIVDNEGPILTIRLNHPPVNSIDRQMMEEIHRVLTLAEQNEKISDIILTGQGKHFSAGADIKNEIAPLVLGEWKSRKARLDAAFEFSQRGQELVLRIRDFPKPVVAHINGLCLGGGFEIAIACRRRTARSNAIMGLPEVTLGIIPGWGGTYLFTRLIAAKIEEAEAREDMPFISPDLIERAAIEAASGFVGTGSLFDVSAVISNLILEPIVLEGESVKVPSARPAAPKLAERIPEFIMRQQQMGGEKTALEEESNYFADLVRTDEAQEGIRAFLEKRLPNFKK